MESLLKGKTFSVKEVVSSTIEVCHGNYKEFFVINILVIFTSMIATILNLVVTSVISNPFVQILGFLVVILVAIFMFYFAARITIVQYYTVYDYVHNIRRSFGEKYKTAGEIIWRYIGASLLIALMVFGFYIVMVIVIAVVAVISINSEFTGGRIAIIAITSMVCLAGMAAIGVKFYLGILVRVFEQDNPSYFKKSALLVRGKFMKVLWLYAIPTLIQLPIIGVLFYLNFQQMINTFVYMSGTVVASLFVGPYVSCGIVVMYFLLREDTKTDQPLEIVEASM